MCVCVRGGKSFFFERQRLSHLIHRDYKHYFGISLGIIFSDDTHRTTSQRESTIETNTSGQFLAVLSLPQQFRINKVYFCSII